MVVRILLCLLLTLHAYAASKTKEIEIPRTAYKDQYKYYVLEESKKNTLFTLTYKRVGFDNFSFGKVEVNCPSRVIRSLGTSVTSVKSINTANPSQWSQARIGAIESDMIAYICR